MSIDQMRDYISKHPKYKNSPRWIDRVRRMPDAQVFAIYKQFQKVDYRKMEKELKEREKDKYEYHQMTIFDLMK